MKPLLPLIFLLLLAPGANAGWLPATTITSPMFDASTTGDTCSVSIIPQVGNMTLRRTSVGPLASYEDSVTLVPPGIITTSPILNNIPRGTYTVTVDWRDIAGNWSCTQSILVQARGKPARGTIFGIAELQRETLLRFYIERKRMGWEWMSAH